MGTLPPLHGAPAAQPPLPAPAASPRGWAAHAGQRVLFWAPVWAPLVVLTQLALLGLGPALAKSRELGASERELDARLERERDERAQLERVLRAQSDPIYLERERRLLRDEHGPLSRK